MVHECFNKKKHPQIRRTPPALLGRLLPPVEGEGLLGLLEKDPSLPGMSRAASGDAQLETPIYHLESFPDVKNLGLQQVAPDWQNGQL